MHLQRRKKKANDEINVRRHNKFLATYFSRRSDVLALTFTFLMTDCRPPSRQIEPEAHLLKTYRGNY